MHLHVIPRWKGDGVKIGYKPGRPARADLDANAADAADGPARAHPGA